MEDRVNGFMRPIAPLAAHAPDHVIQIDSLSKRLIPGLAVGLIISPKRFVETLAQSIRIGGWMAPTLAIALAEHWVEEGTVKTVEELKSRDARLMHDITKKPLER